LSKGQFPEQKVLLRYNGLNIVEIENEVHCREIRVNMLKARAMKLLFEKSCKLKNLAIRFSFMVL
jgi:hypothetical protein